MSPVMCHVSRVMCHMYFFFYKVVKLIDGESVINGAYLVLFLNASLIVTDLDTCKYDHSIKIHSIKIKLKT